MDFILLLKYVFLGLLQGLTEPIPISSSGHLVLAQHLFGMTSSSLTFELLVNAGSLVAVIIVYWSDIRRLVTNAMCYIGTGQREVKADFMFILYLIVATIPAGVVGICYKDTIAHFFKGMTTIGFTLILTAIALYVIRHMRGKKQDRDIRFTDAIIVGFAQMIALVPGISRSGATMVAGISVGMKPNTALKFSFLMYIPVSFGATLLSIREMAQDPNIHHLFVPYSAAFLVSAIATYFSLHWFRKVLMHGNLIYFSVYCFVVGTAVVLFA